MNSNPQSFNYWCKQVSDKPLFPDLLWSRPENKTHAGKLLIIGGNAYGFVAPAEAYSESLAAGVGVTRVLLPYAVKKVAGAVFPAVEFASSTPSGSFSKQALAELLAQSAWADGVLLAGDLGHNSETAQLLETYVTKYTGQLTLTHDAVDYFRKTAPQLLMRADTCIVLSFEQLQKLATNVKFTKAFTFSQGLVATVETLHAFTEQYPANIVTKLDETIIVARGGQVSTTKTDTNQEIWRVKTAAHAAVWWLQNPEKVFEALTTSMVM